MFNKLCLKLCHVVYLGIGQFSLQWEEIKWKNRWLRLFPPPAFVFDNKGEAASGKSPSSSFSGHLTAPTPLPSKLLEKVRKWKMDLSLHFSLPQFSTGKGNAIIMVGGALIF